MGYRVRFINRMVYIMIIIWSLLLFSAGFISVYENYTYADSLAENEAVVSVKKDLAYRSWVASHGGVYVPITEKTLPNPYLSHLPNRDVNTTSNQQLTLMNGAYTLSQMMKDYRELYGTKGHITSLILTNPINKPDAWEEKVLHEVELTRKAVFVKAFIDGEEYFRYLKPLITQKSCLKCHAFQGYKEGDIRGGVSVSIPLKKFYADAFFHSVINLSIIFIIYILGLIVIYYGQKKARETVERKIKDYEQHVFSLVDIIEKRDRYTAGHTQRVAKYSVLIAKEMGFNQEKVDEVYRACMLHDIGKISTPDSILLKPGKLTELEYEIIKEHVVVSFELLNKVDIYKNIAEIIRHHHEHYDGSGYPQGLKADQIPIMSQIMTVADAFDAMTTNRIYKARKSVEVAILELKELSGKQFNTQIVNVASIALCNIEIEVGINQKPKSKIEKERFSYFYRDQVTGVYNRDYLEFILAYNHSDEFNIKSVHVIYLHDFNQYNKKFSWAQGDKLLKEFAEELDLMKSTDFVVRIYGDDFVVLNKEDGDISNQVKVLETILKNTGVSQSYKYFNLNKRNVYNLEDLEKLL